MTHANEDLKKVDLTKGAIRYLLSRLRGRRGALMFVAFLMMVGFGTLTNAPALLLGRILDQVIGVENPSFALVVPGLLLITGCILGREVLSWGRKFIVETVATRIEREEFIRVITRLLTMDLSVMVSEQIGAMHTRIQRSIDGIVRLVKLLFIDFLPTTVQAVIAVGMASSCSVTVAGIMISVAALGSIVTYLQVSSQKGIRLEIFGAKEAIGAKVNELLNGIGFVRASGLISAELDSSGELAEAVRSKEMRHHKWMMSFDALKQLVEGGGYVAVIAYAAWQAAQGNISKGDVLALAILYMSVATPLRELHRIVDEGYEAILKVRELAQLHALPSDPGLSGNLIPTMPEATIRVRNLTARLSGPEGKNTLALNDLSVEIPEGQVVGIAGPSGSGKSTFAHILLGLISDYEGSAKVSGIELIEWEKESLARLIGYVPQAPFLLAGTVRQNLLYGPNGALRDDDAIWRALDAAQIADRVGCLPDSLDALVSEAGRNFSGGEKQRLAIARLFLRQARILVLDEATSALDSENEARIQESMISLSRGKTTLIIAHRLSTLRDVDRVLVFQDGRIVQDGAYTELVARPGVFRELVERQKHLDLATEA